MSREALADPAWQLADFDPDYWAARNERPPAKPPAKAELAQPACWASLYDGRRLIAVWYRPEPIPPRPAL